MTPEEVRKEFLHDLHRAKAKSANTFNQLLTDLRRRKQQHAIETIIWKSPSYNRWMMIYNLNGRDTYCIHICLTLDRGGFLKTLAPTSSIRHTEMYITECNIHFFKRYNERLKLGLTKPEQIVKHYFKHDTGNTKWSHIKHVENESKLNLFMPVNGGVALGFAYDDIHFIEMKTFVSDEMLRASQMEKLEFLRNYREQDHPPVAPLL